MKGKLVLYLDQYGNKIWACTRKELQEKAGGGRMFKIYADKKDGTSVHVGYGVGERWYTGFFRMELPA